MEQQQAATLAQLADDVVEMLYDSDDSVRENSLVTLCKMKPARLALHADAVAARLEDSVWQVRTVALVTLGELEAATLAKHADAVVQRLEDSNEDVRAAATQTLEKLQPSALAQLAVAMHETGSCRQYRASLPLPMWSSGDSRPPVPWSPEERRREMTTLIANQKGAASTFYTVYAPDDVHEHDVDVTRWASRGVAEAVPLDSCTRAMPPRACCVLGLCLYRGSA